MGEEKIILKIHGEERQYERGTQFLTIAKEYQKDYKNDIILVSVNHRLCEERRGSRFYYNGG